MIRTAEMNQFLQIHINEYESPLDLIYHLLELNQVDIYNIPIFDITEQYLSVIRNDSLKILDMELASEFLVMAATLMQIKSRMLLPDYDRDNSAPEGNDPREELVLRLLAYRRNKYMAEELQKNFRHYQGICLKKMSEPEQFGLSFEIIEDKLRRADFLEAVKQIEHRNQLRFNDQNQRIRQLLRREKFSVQDKMREVVARVSKNTRMFFNELFPASKTSKAERISGFLALLELIRRNKIIVKQSSPFSVIMIKLDKETVQNMNDEQDLNLEIDPEEAI